MYIRRRIRLKHIFLESWKFLIFVVLWSTSIVYVHEILQYEIISIPYLPLSSIGIAVSLYLGFKSTSSYNRYWEARMIWGEIINNSRSWINQVHSLVYNLDAAEQPLDKKIQNELLYRHVAWVNALVYQLRKNSRLKNSQVTRIFDHKCVHDICNDYHHEATCFKGYLSTQEHAQVSAMNNPAVHILNNQSKRLQALVKENANIKNTPFPRPIARFGEIFTWVFILMLPFAFLDVFAEEAIKNNLATLLPIGHEFALLPFAMIIA